MVAASGTRRTLKPFVVKWSVKVAIAVVLPAQGPPVRQTRKIGCFEAEITLGWSRWMSCMRVFAL